MSQWLQQVLNFQAALQLFERIGAVAEAENHHPNLHLEGWSNVYAELSTQSVGVCSHLLKRDQPTRMHRPILRNFTSYGESYGKFILTIFSPMICFKAAMLQLPCAALSYHALTFVTCHRQNIFLNSTHRRLVSAATTCCSLHNL